MAITLMMVTSLVSNLAIAQSLDALVRLSPAGSFNAKTEAVEGFVFPVQGGYGAENIRVDLTGIKTGISLRDRHLQERMQTEKFPQARLIRAMGREGKGQAIIEIMGKQHRVQGDFRVEDNIFHAQFPLKLSDLDITDVRYMGVGVRDEIEVNLTLPIRDRQPASQPRSRSTSR